MKKKESIRDVKATINCLNKLLRDKSVSYSSLPKSEVFREYIAPRLFNSEAIEVNCGGGLKLDRFSDVGRKLELLDEERVQRALDDLNKWLDQLMAAKAVTESAKEERKDAKLATIDQIMGDLESIKTPANGVLIRRIKASIKQLIDMMTPNKGTK